MLALLATGSTQRLKATGHTSSTHIFLVINHLFVVMLHKKDIPLGKRLQLTCLHLFVKLPLSLLINRGYTLQPESLSYVNMAALFARGAFVLH
jgi:hypothetical protein